MGRVTGTGVLHCSGQTVCHATSDWYRCVAHGTAMHSLCKVKLVRSNGVVQSAVRILKKAQVLATPLRRGHSKFVANGTGSTVTGQ
jgi:hypothetical protein